MSCAVAQSVLATLRFAVPSAILWRDPFAGRHAVPYPMTSEWDSTRTWGQPPLHIDNLASLPKPLSERMFPVRPCGTPQSAKPPLTADKSKLQPGSGLPPCPGPGPIRT